MKFSILPIAAATVAFPYANAVEDNAAAFALASENILTLAAEHDFLRPGHSLNFDTVSPQCEAEMEELSTNSDLMTAVESMGQTCPISQSGNTVRQDFGSCDAGQVQLACTAAGGTFTTVDSIHITCTASRQTSRQTIHMEMKDMPDCIGKSCDGSYVATDEGKQDMAKLMELLFQSQGISATCTAADSATVVPRPPATTPETPHNYPQHHTTLSSANSILWNKTIMLGGFLLLATNIFS